MDVTIPLFRISQPPDSLFKVQVKMVSASPAEQVQLVQ